MKSEFLLDVIGEINEKYILEAAPGGEHARPWLGKTIIAAAAVLVIGAAAMAIPRLYPQPEPATPIIGEPAAEAPRQTLTPLPAEIVPTAEPEKTSTPQATLPADDTHAPTDDGRLPTPTAQAVTPVQEAVPDPPAALEEQPRQTPVPESVPTPEEPPTPTPTSTPTPTPIEEKVSPTDQDAMPLSPIPDDASSTPYTSDG